MIKIEIPEFDSGEIYLEFDLSRKLYFDPQGIFIYPVRLNKNYTSLYIKENKLAYMYFSGFVVNYNFTKFTNIILKYDITSNDLYGI